MRPYFNISDDELAHFGALREWDHVLASALTPSSRLLWIHAAREKLDRDQKHNPCWIKTVTLEKIAGDVLQTDFGFYSLYTGKNITKATPLIKRCSCQGQLYLFKENHEVSHRYSA